MWRYAPDIDQSIAKLARTQQGYVTRSQLLGLGLSADSIARRGRAGRLIRVHDGVYAVGHVPNGPIPRAMAAVLACGDGAVLSHHSAAALWGFRKWRAGPIEVTAPGKHRRRGIKAHRCALTRRDRTRHHGIPVTTPARTLTTSRPTSPRSR